MSLQLNGTAGVTYNDGSNQPAAASPYGLKNLIINGDMQIAQRGTSVAGITSSGYYTVDRWQPFISTAGTWTMSQDTDVPTGQGFSSSVKFACTTANTSLSTNSQMRLAQHIEAYNVQHLAFGTANAKKVTFSFWIKSNKTGTYNVWAYRQDSSRQSSIQFTISLANTWEKKTLTFDGDTTGTINNDNGRGIEFNIVFVAGTDYSTGTSPDGAWETLTNPNRYVGNVNLADSTSNYINITGVQLEIGTTATPFENRMYGTELALCQRYYQRNFNPQMVVWYGSSSCLSTQKCVVSMRAAPTCSAISGVAQTVDVYGVGNVTYTTNNFDSQTVNGFRFFGACTANYGTGQPGHIKNDMLQADAEL